MQIKLRCLYFSIDEKKNTYQYEKTAKKADAVRLRSHIIRGLDGVLVGILGFL